MKIKINKQKTHKTKKNLNKAKRNKRSTELPLSLFCVDQVLLGMGPVLKSG